MVISLLFCDLGTVGTTTLPASSVAEGSSALLAPFRPEAFLLHLGNGQGHGQCQGNAKGKGQGRNNGQDHKSQEVQPARSRLD